MDGFVYGALVGLGFSVVEDVGYFMINFGGDVRMWAPATAAIETNVLDLVSGATTTIPGTSTHPVVHGYAINASGTVVGRIAKQLLNRQYDDEHSFACHVDTVL